MVIPFAGYPLEKAGREIKSDKRSETRGYSASWSNLRYKKIKIRHLCASITGVRCKTADKRRAKERSSLK